MQRDSTKPKLNLLTNHNRLLLHMQIRLPLVDKLGTSTAKTIALRAMNPFLGAKSFTNVCFFWEGNFGPYFYLGRQTLILCNFPQPLMSNSLVTVLSLVMSGGLFCLFRG